MKRILAMFLLLVSYFTASNDCYASNDSDDKKPTMEKPIVVREECPNFHRSLGTPIFAYYAAGTITLDFVENLGVATVAVQNLTVGGQVVELIDTSMGNAVVDIESILTVGGYYMSITTTSGDVYYAEFTLE